MKNLKNLINQIINEELNTRKSNSLFETKLQEVPIGDFEKVGDWSRRSSFSHPVDRKLLTNPKAVQKIKKQWEKTPYDFNMYLVNDPRVNKSEFREVGEVDLSFVRTKLKLTEEEVPDPKPGSITIIYTGNFGAERYMASGWILAHRLGHAIARGSGDVVREWEWFTNHLRKLFAQIMEDVYDVNLKSKKYDFMDTAKKDKMLKYIAQELGTMRAARNKKLRNWYEFGYELLSQYLLTGKIKLNPLPNNIVVGMGGWGRKETRGVKNPESQEMYNRHDLEYYSNELEGYLEGVLDRAVGKIFVM